MPLDVPGKDLSYMLDDGVDRAVARPRRQRPPVGTAEPGIAQGAHDYSDPYYNQQASPPLRNGQWRTQFKRVGQNLKTTFSMERPEIHSANGVVHIHTERFDVIVRFQDVELLEVEFGDMPKPVLDDMLELEQEEVEPNELDSGTEAEY